MCRSNTLEPGERQATRRDGRQFQIMACPFSYEYLRLARQAFQNHRNRCWRHQAVLSHTRVTRDFNLAARKDPAWQFAALDGIRDASAARLTSKRPARPDTLGTCRRDAHSNVDLADVSVVTVRSKPESDVSRGAAQAPMR